MKLLVINGPNINMLGIREKNIYGSQTYESLLRFIRQVCQENGVEVEHYIISSGLGCLIIASYETFPYICTIYLRSI